MEDPAQRLVAGRARAERTVNMSPMSVTLDVSKLSGWLNARASCRGEREAWEEMGDMRGRATGGRGAGAGQAVRREDCGVCWQGTRGAYRKHLFHGRDSGCVEAQRLVEHRHALPRRKGSIGRRTPQRQATGGGRAWGTTAEQAECVGRTQLWRLLAGHARSAPETCSPYL